MRKLICYETISLDGFFVDAGGDMSWAHKRDEEWNTFVAGNAGGGGTLVFGRKTYDLMAGYWPTPMAKQNSPHVADHMNALPKVVFSRSMMNAAWNNTTLIKGDLIEEVQKLKQQDGQGMCILGSGQIVSQLTEADLIDEYQIALSAIVLGKGRTLFEGTTGKHNLKLTSSRAFKNGNVFLTYEPAGK
jgi:dihydrofolate reductase